MKILGFGTQKPDVLQNVRVASPCPASWDKMAGDDRTRHCSECNLKVYNISAMTRREAEELLTAREGRLCVRYYRRADGTILTQDCPRGLRAATHRLIRIAGAALAACMGMSFAVAQNPAQSSQEKMQGDQKGAGITIKVLDAQGAAVSNAAVKLKNAASNTEISRQAGANGVLNLSGLTNGTYTLTVNHAGFQPYSQTITLQRQQTAKLDIVLRYPGVVMGRPTMGIVGRYEPPHTDKRAEPQATPSQ